MTRNNDSLFYSGLREIRDLRQMISESCSLYADRTAYLVKKYKGGEFLPLSYRMLKNDIDALGTKLYDMGLCGRNIALIGTGCYEWMVTYLAVVCGIGVIVPVDRELDSGAIQNLIDRAECDTIFYVSEESEKIDRLTGIKNRIEMEFYGDRTDFSEPLIYQEKKGVISWKKLIGEGEELIRRGHREFLDASVDADALSVILFTSGTTGIPKGVMLSHANIASNVMDICRASGISKTDSNLSVLPIHHTYACSYNLTFLYAGGCTAFFEGLKYIVSNLNEAKPTFFIIVPLIAEMIYDRIWKEARKAGKAELLRRALKASERTRAIGIDMRKLLLKTVTGSLGGRLETVVTAASAISPAVVRGFEDLGITVLQAYGLTETSPLISSTPRLSDDRYKKAGSVGLCNTTGQLKIVRPDEDGIGEVWFRGPNVMLGYYKMPEETAAVMDGDWFSTGDLGFVDPDGWLYITGRKKNVIVTKNGENIYPEEIEVIVNNHPFISDCMIYPSHRDGSEIVAVQIVPNMENIMSDLGKEPAPEELQKLMKDIIGDINETMSSYKRIRSIVIRKEDFVRTTTKKIIRNDNLDDGEGKNI